MVAFALISVVFLILYENYLIKNTKHISYMWFIEESPVSTNLCHLRRFINPLPGGCDWSVQFCRSYSGALHWTQGVVSCQPHLIASLPVLQWVVTILTKRITFKLASHLLFVLLFVLWIWQMLICFMVKWSLPDHYSVSVQNLNLISYVGCGGPRRSKIREFGTCFLFIQVYCTSTSNKGPT